MITKWKLNNFKSVRNETELEIAPLTIFAGANSSGKSTFLQSILLISQTLSHKVTSRSVVLNGALTRLGQFDDLKSDDSESDQIVIGWTCTPIDRKITSRKMVGNRRWSSYYVRTRHRFKSISCEISFDSLSQDSQRELSQIQPRLFSSNITSVFSDEESGDKISSITVTQTTEEDQNRKKWLDSIQDDDQILRKSLNFSVSLDDNSLDEMREELISAEPIGCILRHFLPDRLSLGVDLREEYAHIIAAVLTGDERSVRNITQFNREIPIPKEAIDVYLTAILNSDPELANILKEKGLYSSDISITNFIEIVHQAPYRIRMRRSLSEPQDLESKIIDAVLRNSSQEYSIVSSRPPSTMMESLTYIDHFFSNMVRYLGPLRDEPKPLYPISPTIDPFEVGLKGENTAAVLDLNKNRVVKYIPSSCFSKSEITLNPINRFLEKAVCDWLEYLGVAQTVHSLDKGKLGHEMKVSVIGSKKPHDLTHVGVGLSQVLPILVASLLADSDTTLIFEQPELHLHPKVQTLLADFFLSMTALGKQCIVETHSEYLINRIRHRTAAATDSNPWLSAIKVFFVERSAVGSSFREVKINEYGAVLDWPEGFFDQSQAESEAILRAASKKRKLKREDKNA